MRRRAIAVAASAALGVACCAWSATASARTVTHVPFVVDRVAFAGDSLVLAKHQIGARTALARLNPAGIVKPLAAYHGIADRAGDALSIDASATRIAAGFVIVGGCFEDEPCRTGSRGAATSSIDGSGAETLPICDLGPTDQFPTVLVDADTVAYVAPCVARGIQIQIKDFADPTRSQLIQPGRCFDARVQLAGDYVAWEEGCSVAEVRVVVYNLRERAVAYTAPRGAGGNVPEFALGHDGVVVQASERVHAASFCTHYGLIWRSPAERSAHDIPGADCVNPFGVLEVGGGIVSYARQATPGGTGHAAVSPLGGGPSQLIARGAAADSLALDLEGGRVAYARRACTGSTIVVDDLTAAQPPADLCPVSVLRRSASMPIRGGRHATFAVIRCPAGCQGQLQLTALGRILPGFFDGEASFQVKPGERGVIRVRISPRLARIVARRRRLTVHADLTVTHGSPRRTTWPVVLRAGS